MRTQPSTPRSSAVSFGPGAKADALHPAADDDTADHVHPNSLSLRGPAAKRYGNQWRKDAMYELRQFPLRAAAITISM